MKSSVQRISATITRKLALALMIGIVASGLLVSQAGPASARTGDERCDQSRYNYYNQCLYVSGSGTYVNYIWYSAVGYPYTNSYGYSAVDMEISWVDSNGQRKYFDVCGNNGPCWELGSYSHYIYLYKNLPNGSDVWANIFCEGGACDPGGPIGRVDVYIG